MLKEILKAAFFFAIIVALFEIVSKNKIADTITGRFASPVGSFIFALPTLLIFGLFFGLLAWHGMFKK